MRDELLTLGALAASIEPSERLILSSWTLLTRIIDP